MIPLRQSRSIADSHDSAAAIAGSNHVAAVAMTSLQRSLSAIGGSDFAAVPMISLRPSRSIEDSHDLVAAMARSNYVAAGDVTSPRESLSVTAAEKITTLLRTTLGPGFSCYRRSSGRRAPAYGTARAARTRLAAPCRARPGTSGPEYSKDRLQRRLPHRMGAEAADAASHVALHRHSTCAGARPQHH